MSGFTKMNESESVTSSLLGPKVVQLLVELTRLTRYKGRTIVTRVLKQVEFGLLHFIAIHWLWVGIQQKWKF